MYSLGFGFPGHWEWVVLLVIGLLLFGRRLPDVGRNVGRAIVEFKKGVKGITDEIEEESSRSDSRSDRDRSDRSLEGGETARLDPPAAPTVARDPAAHQPVEQPPRAKPATE